MLVVLRLPLSEPGSQLPRQPSSEQPSSACLVERLAGRQHQGVHARGPERSDLAYQTNSMLSLNAAVQPRWRAPYMKQSQAWIA